MKLSENFGRWTTTKAALAVAGALAIGGAVGSAIAMSPIIAPPIKWQGGAEFATIVSGGAGPLVVYTVPAGRNLILTDLIVGNTNTNHNSFTVYSGLDGACNELTPRLADIIIPPVDSAYVSLQTGVGFTAGKAVCIATTGNMPISGRGFLFTPTPPS